MANTDIFPPFNLPNEAIPWGRVVQRRVVEGEISEGQLAQKVDNGLRATSGQLTSLSRQVNSLAEVIQTLSGVIASLPISLTESSRTSGGGLSGSWATVASTEIAYPEGKTQASVTAIGNAAYLDTLSSGATSSYLRIVINGGTSPEFAASKDAGATRVNNVLSGTHSRNLSGGSSVTVSLQAYGLNGSAFPPSPSNYANLTTLITFQ